jgi:capsular polysaccharide biosynthesis protein
VRYPEVRNLDLVNPGAKTAMEISWCRDLFDEHDVEIFQLRGAFFSEECLVFDDRLRVVINASDEYSDDEISKALASIERSLAEQKLPHLAGPGVVSKRRAVNNYGHFLMECLPMAVIGGAVCGDRQPTFLLHRVQPALLDVVLRAFRLLGITPDRLEIRDYGEPMHFEELIVVRGLTRHGTYMSPLCAGAVAKLAENIEPASDKKLFVKRVPGWGRRRHLLNEARLISRLEPLGFRAIEPSQLTLEQQIAAFSGAEDVIGVGGAAMTNIAFCRPGTRVVSLASPNFSDTFFWFIATHKGLR